MRSTFLCIGTIIHAKKKITQANSGQNEKNAISTKTPPFTVSFIRKTIPTPYSDHARVRAPYRSDKYSHSFLGYR